MSQVTPNAQPSSSSGGSSGGQNARMLQRTGEAVYSKMEKINSELLALTYGCAVAQLVKEKGEVVEVNRQLERMGYDIGCRLIDEFLAKSSLQHPCRSFTDTAEVIAKVGVRMFLGVNAFVKDWNKEMTQYTLVLEENPLLEFVELTDDCRGLDYSSILAGTLRGALEMVQFRVESRVSRCPLIHGGDSTEITIKLIDTLTEQFRDE